MGTVARIPSRASGVEYRSWKGVVITPGEMAFTRIPSFASSLARARV